jgi:ABC-type lipoprotein export system ATPase subunit
MSVAENLLFGTPRSPAFQPANLPGNPDFVALLREVGLLDDLYAAGVKVAGLMVELFADVAPDSDLFSQYSFISADDLPEFRVLLTKIADGTLAATTDEERASLLALTFRLVAAQHRVGVIDDGMQRKIVEARAELRRRYAGREDVVEFFEADRFSSTLSIQDNILFGRVALEHANAQGRVNALVREVAAEVGMNAELVRLGLEYEVGNGGSRLSYSQRQRLAIARGIMKNPDILVFNEPTSGLDPATETRVLHAVLDGPKGAPWSGRSGAPISRGVRPRADLRRRPAGRRGILRRARPPGDAPVAASRLTPPMPRLGCSLDRVSRLIAIVCLALANVGLATVYEASPNDYRQSIKRLRAGDTLLLAAGEYREGLAVHGLSGRLRPSHRHRGPRAGRPRDVRRASRTKYGQHRRFELRADSQSRARGEQQSRRRCEGRRQCAAGRTTSRWRTSSSGVTATTSRPVGISTKCPAWNWVIRGVTIVGAARGCTWAIRTAARRSSPG